MPKVGDEKVHDGVEDLAQHEDVDANLWQPAQSRHERKAAKNNCYSRDLKRNSGLRSKLSTLMKLSYVSSGVWIDTSAEDDGSKNWDRQVFQLDQEQGGGCRGVFPGPSQIQFGFGHN